MFTQDHPLNGAPASLLLSLQRFLNEYLKKNSDDAEVALAVELLQECDAAGDSDAVRTLVESYLPQ